MNSSSLISKAVNNVDNHAIKLFNDVLNLFDVNNVDSKFTDIQVKVENRKFYCHKLLLQLRSEYFAKALYKMGTITLKGINSDQFCDILQFVYTGEVLLSTNNIESLLSAADILGMNDLKRICIAFLEELYNKYQAGNSRLAVLYQTFCLSGVKVFESTKLRDTSEELLKVIVDADNLDVKSEEVVCEMLMKWLQLRTEAGHEVHPDQLLPLIRWSGISVDYVKSNLLQNTTLTSDPACIRFMSKVLTYLQSGVQFEGLRTFHRPSTGLENCLMIIGLSTFKASGKICCVSLQHREVVIPPTVIPTKLTIYSAACLLNKNTVYLTGSGDAHNQTWMWNSNTGWSRCADMIKGRRAHCLTVVDTTLYVLSGQSSMHVSFDKTVNNVFGFDTDTNKWSSAGELIHAVKLSACVTYKNYVYVFGGSDKDSHPVAYVQVYDPDRQSCTLGDRPMPRAYAKLRAVLWETYTILLGHETCLVYNMETETWQERKRFRTGITGCATILDNSAVYIAGGMIKGAVQTTYTDEIKSVSVLDIIEDRHAAWKQHARLPRPALIYAYVSMSLPTNLAAH